MNPTGQALRVYQTLARWKLPRSYTGKLFLIAFIGTHVPLLALLARFALQHSVSRGEAVFVLLTALIATLGGTGATLWTLSRMLAPVGVTQQTLRAYLDSGTLPDLPTNFPDEAGLLMADTQHTIRRIEELIKFVTSHDSVTALPNREFMLDAAAAAIAHSSETNGPIIAIYVLDLRGFHSVNELMGQQAGDIILDRVAGRLMKEAPAGSVVGRLGGDEFVVLQNESVSPESADLVLCRLLKAISGEPFTDAGRSVTILARGGIAIACAAAREAVAAPRERAVALLRDAEAAMYQAKRENADYLFFSTELNARHCERRRLEEDLRSAAARGEMVLHFQPQIDLSSGRVVGVEALIRWNREGKGLVSPTEFLPIAEESDTILALGEWTLREACRQARAWQDAGLPPFRVAVNLSVRQLASVDLPGLVRAALSETGLDPTLLELEVTESLAMQDVVRTVEVMNELRDMGVRLALDDFGTGYSSLAYLQRLPLDTVKIDRQFVRDICRREGDAAIAEAVIALVHSLQMETVAEGVESSEQSARLRDAGCDHVQGFYYSRPVAASDLAELISDFTRAEAPATAATPEGAELVWSPGERTPVL